MGELTGTALLVCVQGSLRVCHLPRSTTTIQALEELGVHREKDALDVVVPAPTRGPPASSVAGVSGPPPVHPGPVLFHVGVAAAGPGVSV